MSHLGHGLWEDRAWCMVVGEPAGILPTGKGAGWGTKHQAVPWGSSWQWDWDLVPVSSPSVD